jgi:hypothetical protein
MFVFVDLAVIKAKAMVLNVTFNYISVRFIGGETVVPRENHRSAASQ